MAEKFKIENAELPKWPTNFSGRVSDMNPNGFRTFCVKIPDPEIAQIMAADGYNVKHHDPRDGDEKDDFDYLQISVSWARFEPLVVMCGSNGKQIKLNESNVGQLDDETILSVDVVISPYHYHNKLGRSGVIAFAKELWVTIDDSYSFRDKHGYRDESAIHPNDYSVLRTQELREEREQSEHGQSAQDDLPFDIP